MTLQTGSIIEFQDKNRILVAVCLQTDGKSVRILTEQNREVKLTRSKIAHVLERRLPASLSRFEMQTSLREWAERCEAVAQEGLDLQLLWEVLQGESGPQDVRTLAGLYYPEATDEGASVLLRGLVEDHTYFEKKGEGLFAPRPAGVIERLLHQQQTQKQRQESRSNLVAWLRQVQEAETGWLAPPPGTGEWLRRIQDFVIQGRRYLDYNTIYTLLSEAGLARNVDDLAFELLVKAGVWDIDENLKLFEHDIPQQFSEKILEEAHQLTRAFSVEGLSRRDLRGIQTLSIDDEETTDIDDAFSLQTFEDGYCLGIHIADVAHFIAPESLLDKEASRRSTSIYLPERKIEMLPALLSERLCSLVQGEPRLAVSILIRLDRGFEIQAIDLCETIIEVNQRLTYDEVNHLLETETILQQLLAMAQSFKQTRLQQGAVEFNQPELRIKVTADKQIHIKKVPRDSPANVLVSELMILANHLVARQLHEASIPMIFKVQAKPADEGKPFLKRSEMSTQLSQHYGLGLSAYTQMTSPIRRYHDLLLHRQLKHWLHTQQPLYSTTQLQHKIALSEQALSVVNVIQREGERYWLFKYLHQLAEPVLEAQVLDIQEDRYLIYLLDFCFTFPFYPSHGLRLDAGQRFRVRIDSVSPRKGLLHLSYVPEA